MISASVDDYINSDTPFHVYYLTISGHMPYSDNRVVAPYRDVVRALPYSETTQNYVATAIEVDRALELLLQKLEAAGKLDKTLIVATGDHIPYFNVDTLEELSGQTFGSSKDMESLNEKNINFDVYKNSLILWSASMEEPVIVDKPCCQVDILPTVSNLLGLEYDSRMLAGSDILSDSEGLVIFTSTCWRTDRGFYNRFTQEFTPAEGVTMTAEEQENYVSAMKKLVSYKLKSTPMIVENNFYNEVFGG
jgi:lipoteichoic acid synthase